ncbi:zinc finger protein 26 [Trichonephila clavipes]|nr:zinc finger protein 26 [Trichonephila clavipes]
MNESSALSESADLDIEFFGNEKIHKCPKCSRTFANVGHMKCHFYKVHPEFRLASCTLPNPQKCDTCEKIFSSKQRLKEHCCVQDPPYKCEECGKCFTLRSSLLRHCVRIHTKEKIHLCKICNRDFSSNWRLVAHVKKFHGKTITCNGCDSNSTNNKDHIKECLQRKHSANKCDICNKTFDFVSGLKKHIRTHTQEKCFQCTVCDKSFAHAHTLNEHYRTHTNEKPFVCETCNTSFSTKSTLTKHYRTHTNEKPFVCKLCNTAFAARHSLERHSRTHKSPKFHVCNVCNKKFKLKCNLVRHAISHKN